MRVGVPPRVDGRAAERRPVGIAGHIREVGGSRLDVEVHDLSRTGFRVACIYNVPAGARIFLTIPTFAAMEAVVAWRDRNGFGCRFEHPLHPAVFDMIVARHPDC
jgi:hypothetical protein